jgi:hypothetical protein
MVTTARRVARPVSLIILILFVVGPGFVSAGPQPAAAAADAAAASTSDSATSVAATFGAASTPITAPSRTFATYSWSSPAGPAPGRGSRTLGDPPRWMDANTPSTPPDKSGSWWSRRTTAQKTWFIVGIVVGAAGIYAIASNHSGGGSGGGGGY